MSSLSQSLSEFNAAVGSARTVKECSQRFLEVLRPYRIDALACGEADLFARERSVFFVMEWPERFRKFYFSSGLLERDAAVEGLAFYDRPFTWSELRADRRLSALGTQALDEIYAQGWTDGLVVPIPRGGHRCGIVSLVVEGGVLDADAKCLISLMSVYFHERVRAMASVQGFAVPPLGLSDREIQCLALIARGRSDREIGLELGIAQSTAHEYSENAKRKLLVNSRAEAIAVAVSLGIVVV